MNSRLWFSPSYHFFATEMFYYYYSCQKQGWFHIWKEANFFLFCQSLFVRAPLLFQPLICIVVLRLWHSWHTSEHIGWICLEKRFFCFSLEAQEWAKRVSKSNLNDPAVRLLLLPEAKIPFSWAGILMVTLRYKSSHKIVQPVTTSVWLWLGRMSSTGMFVDRWDFCRGL